MCLRFSLKKIYGNTAPILRLQLTVQIQEIKYKLKSSKRKARELKSTL